MVEYDILYSTISDADRAQIERFNCGNGALNRYLKRNVYFETVQRTAATQLVKVTLDNGNVWNVIGFFTVKFQFMYLDSSGITYPVIYLKCLAMQKGEQHKGIGTQVLKHVLLQSKAVSDFAGCRAMILDSIPEYTGFYINAGFHPSSWKISGNKKYYSDTIRMIYDFRDNELYNEFLE